MRQKVTNIYSFNELSKEAKENALQYQRENWHYSWGYEAIKSLEAFAELIGLKITDYSIDWLSPYTSYFKYDDTNINKDFYLHAETELTGYAMDYSILRAWNETKSINETLNRFLSACCADYEEQLTDESIEEHFFANNYEFLECGTIY